MSTGREKILRQRPFSGGRMTEAPPETEEIEAALRECAVHGVKDRDSGRVVAYAWYHGVENETVLTFIRNAGAANVLLRELSGYTLTVDDHIALISVLAHSGNCYNFSHYLRQPAVGWAIAVLSVVEVADFDAMVSFIDSPHDPARLIPLFLLVTVIPLPARAMVTRTLIAQTDIFFQEVLIALVCRWVEDAVALEGHPFEPILSEIEASAQGRVIVVGAVFEHVLSHFRDTRLPDDQQKRLNGIWLLLNDIGKRVIQQASDIDAILERAGDRAVEVLAAMSHWRDDTALEPSIARYIGKRANQFIQHYFKSAMYDREGEGVDATFSEGLINPLIEALKFDGITVATFQKLHDRLASDSFSRMTRYATWLNDRRRAVSLVIIAGVVARERSDQLLLSTVEAAASELLSQPNGPRPILTPESAGLIEARLGFPIPRA